MDVQCTIITEGISRARIAATLPALDDWCCPQCQTCFALTADAPYVGNVATPGTWSRTFQQPEMVTILTPCPECGQVLTRQVAFGDVVTVDTLADGGTEAGRATTRGALNARERDTEAMEG